MTKRVAHKSIFAAAALLALTGPAFADWHDRISPSDIDRLAHLEDARTDALAQARGRDGFGDRRALDRIFSPQARSIPEAALYGTWRCRQVKLGGASGYYVFDWFTCRIIRANGEIYFEKNGTQRMAGYLHPQEGMWVYLGAQSAKGEPLHRYSGGDLSAGEPLNPDDQVGVLVGIGNDHLRLDLPLPGTQESDFDAIELVR
jgi:hypothetical protein